MRDLVFVNKDCCKTSESHKLVHKYTGTPLHAPIKCAMASMASSFKFVKGIDHISLTWATEEALVSLVLRCCFCYCCLLIWYRFRVKGLDRKLTTRMLQTSVSIGFFSLCVAIAFSFSTCEDFFTNCLSIVSPQ